MVVLACTVIIDESSANEKKAHFMRPPSEVSAVFVWACMGLIKDKMPVSGFNFGFSRNFKNKNDARLSVDSSAFVLEVSFLFSSIFMSC